MSTQIALRLSPSGPVAKNDAGSPVSIGKGCRLRLVESFSTNGGVIPTTPTPIVTQSVLVLPLPKAGLNYRAQCQVDVLNTSTNVQGTVELYADVSSDNSSWTEVSMNSHSVAPGTARHIALNVPLDGGSQVGVSEGQANLYWRFRIGATATGNPMSTQPVGAVDSNNQGTINTTLEECA